MRPALFITAMLILFAACKKHDPQLPVVPLPVDSIVTENYILTDTSFRGQYPVYPYYVQSSGAINRAISIIHNTADSFLVFNGDTLHAYANTVANSYFSNGPVQVYGRSYTTVSIIAKMDSVSINCFNHISAAASEQVIYWGYKVP